MKMDIPMNGSMVKKPHLIKNGIQQCNTENFVPIVVPGLSANSSSGSGSSTSRTLSRQESHCSTSSSSSSSSPTVSDTETRELEDRIKSDISPVTVSTTVNERSGRPMLTKPIKLQNAIKKSHRKTRCILKSQSGCKNSVKIWWMMKFLNAETHTPVLLM